jgi:hypothetical protein
VAPAAVSKSLSAAPLVSADVAPAKVAPAAVSKSMSAAPLASAEVASGAASTRSTAAHPASAEVASGAASTRSTAAHPASAEVASDAHDLDPKDVPSLFGARVDVGLPEGISASLMVTPVPFMRVHLGGTSNGLGAGFRGGATFGPFNWMIRPTVGLDASYTFGGKAAWLAGALGGALGSSEGSGGLNQVLDRVTIGAVSGHLGLEAGKSRVAFFIQAGISYLDISPVSLDLGNDAGVGAAGSKVSVGFRAVIPSGRLGLMIFLG